MNTNTLATGIVGFLLGGLTVATAADLEDDDDPSGHDGGNHQTVRP